MFQLETSLPYEILACLTAWIERDSSVRPSLLSPFLCCVSGSSNVNSPQLCHYRELQYCSTGISHECQDRVLPRCFEWLSICDVFQPLCGADDAS